MLILMVQKLYMSHNMVYCFDIDNTICTTNGNDYKNSVPITKAISEINRLYEQNNIIKISEQQMYTFLYFFTNML